MSSVNKLLLCLASIFQLFLCSEYNPHIFPQQYTAYFEGWYTRIIDLELKHSFAFIFGVSRIFNVPNVHAVSLNILYTLDGSDVTQSGSWTFNTSQVRITVNGSADYTNPSMDDVFCDFEIALDPIFTFQCFNETTRLTFNLDEYAMEATISNPLPWAKNGEGPDGKLDALALFPLHWFVYSLQSTVSYYKFQVNDTEIINSNQQNSVLAHQEKNWGGAFPTKWIWFQGISFEAKEILLGSILYQSGIAVAVVTYRSQLNNTSWNFMPYNSRLAHFAADYCEGTVQMTLRSFDVEIGHQRVLTLNITSDNKQSSECITGPTNTGWKQLSTENFGADCVGTAVQMDASNHAVHNETVEISHFALEFGGDWPCLQC